MKYTTLAPEQAIRLGLRLPYAYITRLSAVTVGQTPAEVSAEELLEARFFGPDCEIHIWHDGEDLCAASLEDEDGDDCLDQPCRIRRSCFGHRMTLRKYLAYDDDGQAYIYATRLLDWEGDA